MSGGYGEVVNVDQRQARKRRKPPETDRDANPVRTLAREQYKGARMPAQTGDEPRTHIPGEFLRLSHGVARILVKQCNHGLRIVGYAQVRLANLNGHCITTSFGTRQPSGSR